ncbi:hypothetical protein EJ05DRAFT_482746 [Pseudovirgaria hyperparasitica]|uniref:DUF7603 domain-containing protein n=1 Tax=Pseudovirgaria hyperparasitica TaxID=470096 RepID=A0A6A6WIQ1_9PEZI|nr:uncharacterized protein EJ05DRAFT_482746 [Pseudovirgaria hyperparasitica]KAF2761936.1 hypothetical protein EJ05DRAFT_482746 [Pseudovirgaria hyperparasitica]
MESQHPHPPSSSHQPPSRSAPRHKATSLSGLQPASFAAIRAQNSQVPSPVRRKPLPGQLSPQTTRYSSIDIFHSHKPDDRYSKRWHSVDSPTLPDLHHGRFNQSLPPVPDPGSPTEATFPDADTPAHVRDNSLAARLDDFPTPPSSQPSRSRTRARTYSKEPARHDIESDSDYGAHDLIFEEEEPAEEPTPQPQRQSQTMPNYYAGAQPALDIQFDDFLDDYNTSPQSSPPRKLKSPSEKLTSFFGWSKPRQSSVEERSSTTTFSERSASPTSSPMYARQNGDSAPHNKPTPAALDIPKANASDGGYFNVPGTPLLSLSPHMNAHVEELERELKHISSELAASIRREMELEDEVERCKNEIPATATERRTSDYYSDSGASSTRYPFGDSETKLDELEKLRRKAEQEKAQIRSDMASRIQEELRRRRDLEAQVQKLEEQHHGSRRGSQEVPYRELESQLEDAKRRLVEEKQVKENFEDLLSALQKDLELHRNERDNLRDEVVPALKARVEGLEAQAAESQDATYEMSRMQQEMAHIKKQRGFRSIAEEDDGSTSPRMGLSRSNSLARHSITGGKRGSLTRSNSVKELAKSETKEVLSERVKDIEEQRNALHRALKHLIIRHESQSREHSKRIRILEMERDAALNASPRRTAFHKEVTNLRDEVNLLRRRADDALDQKWQVEKGLGGLKMDLDRAQQETSSLRQVLQEHDISVPELTLGAEDSTASPLDKAYKELQTTHALSIARIREMNSNDHADNDDALGLLIQSISDAEAERDAAHTEAERYRSQARALQQSELAHLSKEQSLASDLYAAAQRMDELSGKVERQLSANKTLRERLTKAVARGDEEQKASAAKIIQLERKLMAEEDLVMKAQSQSDDVIARHEDEVKALKESYGAQLQRMKSGLKSPMGHPSPLSPLLLKSPRLDKTTSGLGVSFNEATQADSLEKQVKDLEKALRDADREMEEVVGRMNKAQIEVFELQTDRDEAMRQTKKLQAAMQAEREKVKALMNV